MIQHPSGLPPLGCSDKVRTHPYHPSCPIQCFSSVLAMEQSKPHSPLASDSCPTPWFWELAPSLGVVLLPVAPAKWDPQPTTLAEGVPLSGQKWAFQALRVLSVGERTAGDTFLKKKSFFFSAGVKKQPQICKCRSVPHAGEGLYSRVTVLSVFHSGAKLSFPYSWETLSLTFNDGRGAGGSGARGTPWESRGWVSSHFVLLIQIR